MEMFLKTLLFIVHFCYGMNNEVLDPDLKYILLWTPRDWAPFSAWAKGQETFIERGCLYTNCFIVTREEWTDLSIFDAICFNGRNLGPSFEREAPPVRFPHQKYIYFNQESADNKPACYHGYNDFFNMTATYKLDSDVPFTYIEIRHNGVQVGPKKDMTWLDGMNQTSTTPNESKTKAVAWFVSNCNTRSRRENYVGWLGSALRTLNLDLDVFGGCSKVECPENECNEMLYKYYFYLVFENSFSEDYVTEKLLTALNNGAVPIVYGGANYSRFLPPGSYLDARNHSPDELAAVIQHYIATPAEYNEFFNWRSHYSYHKPDNICRLCEALNNDTLMNKHKVYHEFRRWWNPRYKKRCRKYLYNMGARLWPHQVEPKEPEREQAYRPFLETLQDMWDSKLQLQTLL